MNNKNLLLTTILVGTVYSWAVCPPALASVEAETVPISNNIPVVDTIKISLQAKSDALKGKPTYNSLTHSLNISSGIYNQNEAQKVSALVETIKASNLKEKSGVISSNAEGLNLKNILAKTKKEDPTPIYTELNYVSLTESDGCIMYFYFDKDKNITDIVSVWENAAYHFAYEDLSVEDKEYIDNKIKDLINDKNSIVNFKSVTLEDSWGDLNIIYYDKDGNFQGVKGPDGWFQAKETLLIEQVEDYQELLNNYFNPKEELDRE